MLFGLSKQWFGDFEKEEFETCHWCEPCVARVRRMLLSIKTGATVLLQGESGTGKEVLARLVRPFNRAKGLFILLIAVHPNGFWKRVVWSK